MSAQMDNRELLQHIESLTKELMEYQGKWIAALKFIEEKTDDHGVDLPFSVQDEIARLTKPLPSDEEMKDMQTLREEMLAEVFPRLPAEAQIEFLNLFAH